MLTNWILPILVGTALGFLSGIGAGGGSLLILYLTFIKKMAPAQARLINLLFFIASALIATVFRWKSGQLSIKKALPAIIAGSAAAGICSVFCRNLDTSLLKKLFGLLLIITGIREIRTK